MQIEDIDIPTVEEIEEINQENREVQEEKEKLSLLSRCVLTMRKQPTQRSWTIFGIPKNQNVISFVQDKLVAGGWKVEVLEHTTANMFNAHTKKPIMAKFNTLKITKAEKTDGKRKKN